MCYSASAHTRFYHRFHVVWVTKYRYKVLRGPMRDRIREIIIQTCNEMGVHIVSGVLARDHVHMFLSIPPKLFLSDVMQRIKGARRAASRWSSPNCANAIGADDFGPVDISRPPREMSPTISYFSIWNYIPNAMLPESAGSGSLLCHNIRREIR